MFLHVLKCNILAKLFLANVIDQEIKMSLEILHTIAVSYSELKTILEFSIMEFWAFSSPFSSKACFYVQKIQYTVKLFIDSSSFQSMCRPMSSDSKNNFVHSRKHRVHQHCVKILLCFNSLFPKWNLPPLKSGKQGKHLQPLRTPLSLKSKCFLNKRY